VHQRAYELGIAPALLAPQSTLEKMVSGDGRAALSGWRDSLLGDDLTALLEGKAMLSSTGQGLQLTRA
jgi:hypothetical protein